jgi:anti-anti-sigma factor
MERAPAHPHARGFQGSFPGTSRLETPCDAEGHLRNEEESISVRRRPHNGLSTAVERGTGFVELHGELDITTVVEIEEAFLTLVDRSVDRIVVDFAETSFVDSKAIEALMRSARSARAAGVMVAAAEAQGPLVRVLAVCGLEHAMDVYDTRDDALVATGAPGAGEE